MKRSHTLVLPAKVANELRAHLFPGDGLEAAALLLCTATGTRRSKWLGREVICVPHAECTRRPDFITWPGEYVEAAIDRASARGDAVIAIHSHPGGLFAFSIETTEAGDYVILPSGRFAHSRAHIEELARQGFRQVEMLRTTIRREANRPVEGAVYVLQRAAI